MAGAEELNGTEQNGRGTRATEAFDGSGSLNSSLMEISNAMVGVYKNQFGRGPTKARTYYAGPDTVVCLLEQTFTPAERNLRALGEHQRLRDIRMFFQYAESAGFTGPVERITGRRVRSFISGIDTNTDTAAEVFMLEPQTSDQG